MNLKKNLLTKLAVYLEITVMRFFNICTNDYQFTGSSEKSVILSLIFNINYYSSKL